MQSQQDIERQINKFIKDSKSLNTGEQFCKFISKAKFVEYL